VREEDALKYPGGPGEDGPATHTSTTRIPANLQPGQLVVARNRKWNGKAHWVVPGRYLGEDRHGWWIFQGTNEFCSRPGAAFYTRSDAVLLVPRSGDWVATFYDSAHPNGVRIYIDLAVAHEWTEIRQAVTEFHVIDMDLDVIRMDGRGVFIDDQDEFAEHAVAMNYPDRLVQDVQAAAEELYQAVKAQQAPFDGTDVEWFTRGRL
jgi:protein associated with RNAse G/E